MPTVWIPHLMQDLTGGREQVTARGSTVRELVEDLERRYPGVRERLCDGEQIKSGIAVAVDGAISNQGLRTPVRAKSEVHFLPAIGGGTP